MTNTTRTTDFEGRPEGDDLSVRTDEHIIDARHRELRDIAMRLMENQWVVCANVRGYDKIQIHLDSVTFEQAALDADFGGRNWQVVRANITEASEETHTIAEKNALGHPVAMTIEVQVLEFEAN